MSKQTEFILFLLASVLGSYTDAQTRAAEVVNFEPEREFIPLGSSTTFSCTVVGRAVWSIDPGADDEVTLNTAIAPQLSGNLTDVTGLVGISLSDYTNVDGYNVSVLFLSSSNVESRNGSVVTCGATTSITANPTDQEHHINVYGAPSPPVNILVAPQGDLQVSITWAPSFISFGLTATYNIYLDGQLEASAINEPGLILTRMQPSCVTYEVIVEAVNEVGSRNSTESVSLTIPSIPDVSDLNLSLMSEINKISGQILVTISFMPAIFCTAYPVTNYTIKLHSTSSPNPLTVVDQTSDPNSEITVRIDSSNQLLENVFYSYCVIATNEVGSGISVNKELYTTDVLTAIATEVGNGSLLLRCEFVEGSNALGCSVKFETSLLDNLTHTLYRTETNTTYVEEVISINTNLSCYQRVLVFDIEYDNTTSTLGVLGSLQSNLPCTASVRNPAQDIPVALIAGVAVAVVLLLVIIIVIVVVCAHVLKSSSSYQLRNGNRVKDNAWTKDDSYTHRYTPGSSSVITSPTLKESQIEDGRETSENKLPLYDSVDNYRSTDLDGGKNSQDYHLLMREFGGIRAKTSPPLAETETIVPIYSQLNECIPKEPLYHELEPSKSMSPNDVPPPSYYSEVSDALPKGKRVRIIRGPSLHKSNSMSSTCFSDV